MSLEESRRSQRPYRYGMVLLCVGALINWLGLAENYVEPVRYVGVACIVAGALLICAAMCCWLHAPPSRTSSQTQHASQPITAQVCVYSRTVNRCCRANSFIYEIPCPAWIKLKRGPTRVKIHDAHQVSTYRILRLLLPFTMPRRRLMRQIYRRVS